ncbi:C2-domain-containing protein [Meredithblackwellia eburnea MCA 4105]
MSAPTSPATGGPPPSTQPTPPPPAAPPPRPTRPLLSPPSLSSSSSTTTPAPRKSFLSSIPNLLPRPSLPIPIPTKFRQRRSTLFVPLDPTAPPLGLLVVRVLAAKNLVARDRNGLSDPFVVIRCADSRVVGPTVREELNPVWDDHSGNGQSRLQVLVSESVGLGRERVEIVIWDKDRVGKQYLGEVGLGVQDWWGPKESWTDGRPPVGLEDEGNVVRNPPPHSFCYLCQTWALN